MIFKTLIALTLLALASPAFSADNVWKIFDVKGKASVTSGSGTRSISNEKSLLETIRKGNRVRTESGGRVVIVSLKQRQAFEVGETSEAVVEEDQIRAIKGTVSIKKGYALPKISDGRMGGIVMRGGGNTRSCLKALSPVNTAVLDPSPELRWENNCDGLKQVTVTILADDRVVHSAETGETSLRPPAGVMQPGNRFMWMIDGGVNFDMASGVFTTLSEPDRKEVLDVIAGYGRENSDDVSIMLVHIYFLDGKGLNELARAESDRMRRRFPDSEGLRELP